MPAQRSYGEPNGQQSRGTGRARPVQAVERAVALLKAIAASPHPANATELASRCGLNRSTAWRLLATLEQQGLVERDPLTQRFEVGYATIQVAASARHDTFVRRARPTLERLARDVNETVTLVVATFLSLLYVDQVDPPSIVAANWLGRPIPLHATSAGKVFLAWLPDSERDAVLPRQLERYTPTTITDRVELDRQLEEIRRVGYGTCVGEYEEFSNGVSAAALDHRARPVAIVNIWGPSQRVLVRRLPVLGRMALKAAHQIAVALDL